MKNIIQIALILLPIVLHVTPIIATPLSGLIKSEASQPIPKVKVITYAPLDKQTKFLGLNMTTKRHEAYSDEKGVFRLPDHGRIVYFTHPEKRPLTKIVDFSASTLHVTMEEASATLWKVPQCSAIPDANHRPGIAFKVNVPDGVIVKKDVRFDLDVYYYGYRMPEGKFEVMVNWQDSTSAHPSEEWLLEAKRFTERVWMAGKRLGYDIRGERPDGKVWRYVVYRWGALSYQGNSSEAAKIFDKMIDGMCFSEEDAKKYPDEDW